MRTAMSEVHSDICGAYQFEPELHMQLKRLWYYLPTITRKFMKSAKSCRVCQYQGKFIRQQSEPFQITCAHGHSQLRVSTLFSPSKKSRPTITNISWLLSITSPNGPTPPSLRLHNTDCDLLHPSPHHIQFLIPETIMANNVQPFKSAALYKL